MIITIAAAYNFNKAPGIFKCHFFPRNSILLVKNHQSYNVRVSNETFYPVSLTLSVSQAESSFMFSLVLTVL